MTFLAAVLHLKNFFPLRFITIICDRARITGKILAQLYRLLPMPELCVTQNAAYYTAGCNEIA